MVTNVIHAGQDGFGEAVLKATLFRSDAELLTRGERVVRGRYPRRDNPFAHQVRAVSAARKLNALFVAHPRVPAVAPDD